MKTVIEKFSKGSKIVELLKIIDGNGFEYWRIDVSDIECGLSTYFDKQNAYKAFDLIKEALK
jgi:hypothetical protein